MCCPRFDLQRREVAVEFGSGALACSRASTAADPTRLPWPLQPPWAGSCPQRGLCPANKKREQFPPAPASPPRLSLSTAVSDAVAMPTPPACSPSPGALLELCHPPGMWGHAEPCPRHAPLPLAGRTHPAAGMEQGTPARCSHHFSAAAPLLLHYWSTNRPQPGRNKLLVRWIRESKQQLGQIMALFLLR